METTGQLLREGLELKAKIAAAKARLDEINKEIAARAEFKAGSKTATMAAGGVLAKVQLRETVSWNQEALKAACNKMGADEFRKIFSYEFKPLGARQLNAWMAAAETRDEWRSMVADARQVKAGAPSISYEDVSQEV